MRTNIKSAYRLVKTDLRRLLLLEIIHKLIFTFIVLPLISLGINIALHFTKYSYITTENIFHFLCYPHTIIIVLMIILIVIFMIQMEVASLLFFFEDCKNHKKQNIAQLLIAGVRSTLSIIRRKSFFIPIYTVFISIFLNIPLIVLAITQSGVSSYLMRTFLGIDYVKSVLTLFSVIMLLLSYRRIFVIPMCILDKKKYKEAKKLSLTYMRGQHRRLILQLVGVNIILAVAYLIIYAICFSILVFGIKLFVDVRVAIPKFLQNFEQLNRILFISVSILGAVVNYSLISNLYVRASKPHIKELEKSINVGKKDGKSKLRAKFRRQLRAVIVVLCTLSALTAYSYFYNIIRNGSFRVEESLLGIQITAHRGNSREAPENTIPAIESAIDCLADYAEIDVQLTKDGEVVLCHDSTLYRTAGAQVKVADQDYANLLIYDVGKSFGEDFIGTRVPTLAQILEVSKGKIKLNIEIKRVSAQKELVRKVVELIHEYEFERQCVITSMSYDALRLVKEENPDLKTGYIMSIAYGNFYENRNIDFFSMKSSIVTEDIVKQAHRLGKEVHVWTVNSKNDIRRMAAIGVDNIITDRPVYVQEIIYEVGDTSLIQYIKLIMK